MAVSRRRPVLFLVLFSLLFTKITSHPSLENGDSFASDRRDSSLKHEFDQLKSRISFLELNIDEKAHELRNKEESIRQMEILIQEKSGSIVSLQSEVEYLQKKISLDVNDQMSNTNVHTTELEKQVRILRKEIELQDKKKHAVEVRANVAEGKIQELNLKLDNLQRVNTEQKTRMLRAEHALQLAQEEMVKENLRAASVSRALNEVYGEWLANWLAVHLFHFQSYLVSCWNEQGRPALDITIQKALEKKAQLTRWAEPHIKTINTKWIPLMMEEWSNFISSLEPCLQSLLTRTIEVYHASKSFMTPHVVNVCKMTDHYIQEGRKFAEPHINQVTMVTKPYFSRVLVALEPYTKKAGHAYREFSKSWTSYHYQVQEILRNHHLTSSLATMDLAWFAATALLTLPIILLLQVLSAIFSKKATHHSRGSHISHTCCRGESRHPDNRLAQGRSDPRPERWVRWFPPPRGFIKLNTDGVAKNNRGPAGIGGLIRDDNGNWLGGFSSYIGNTDCLTAELYALREGIKLVKNRGFKAVIVELDSKILVSWLKHGPKESHRNFLLVHDCKQCMEELDHVQIKHTLREGNRCADLLANLGYKNKHSLYYLETPPPELIGPLEADKRGESFYRA